MNITIHRGIDQVGGCITEISTDTTRIFIDMGDNLIGSGNTLTENEKEEMVDGLFKQNKRNNEAVFFTHSHQDHVGMITYIPKDVPKYMSQGTKQLLLIKENIIKTAKESSPNAQPFNDTREQIIKACKTWLRPQRSRIFPRPQKSKPTEPIVVGDISVTPFFVSHSTYDATMFLIVADGKKILHTGDYRGHGYLSKGLLPTLNKYVGQVDFLITEGTMLKNNKKCETEAEISERMQHAMRAFKYVFALTSSTDIERLATIQKATKKANRRFVNCAMSFRSTMDYFNKDADNKEFHFAFDNLSVQRPSKKLIDKMQKEGFVMLVGASHGNIIKQIMDYFEPSQTLLIFSAWDGYYKDEEQIAANPNYKMVRELFTNVIDLHTSGHADTSTITSVINAVNPKEGIIAIHKDANTSLTTLNLTKEQKSKIIPNNKQLDCVIIK